MLHRRGVLKGVGSVMAGLRPLQGRPVIEKNQMPRILLRSSWQTVNIGDIAHTPGVIALLEKYFPEAHVTLWPSSVENGVERILKQRFPRLEIAKTQREIETAIQTHDFLLHGSGPSLVAQKDVLRWIRETDKPFGVFGITIGSMNEGTHEALSKAGFVFFRDSVSLAFAKQQGVKCPVMEFGPDGAFAFDMKDDSRAMAFLEQNGLQTGGFVCCIPRLRYTPYWKIKNQPFHPERHARNEEMKEHDMRPLRETIEAVVGQTEMKVLICPEDQSQMAVGREMLYDRLSESARKRVVWRENYWLTDEAVSVYRRSAGMFGLEMHSPIMCIGNGIPAIVSRFAEQTSKGFMWRDIGLGEWLFDFDQEADLPRLQPAVIAMIQNRQQALQMTEKARSFVQQRQIHMVNTLKEHLL